ncbi:MULTISPECIES: MFS transporter [unclassified Leucobacter]|uniref:MFS transporter n=1 Tax=unclassified Leucobacter TaxID=2621730 RepID=UPI00165D9303|nr:MFS transporter [Leucobacter sp. CX169]MBC9928561.1 MFS transporter [Leucobacter sp. cx-169]MBC9935465.1 MFS transporter [Leucobacter sp. cx-87]
MPATRKTFPFEVWALVAGGFTVALGYGVVAPAIPQFAKAFDVSNLAASAIVSAFALMRLVSAPLAGWLVSRFGERRIYTIGILIVALSTGACALAASYPQLIVLRGLGGIGSAMFSIAATALLVKVSPVEARGRVASINSAGFLLGGLLGPVFGALVASFGIRAPFVFYFITLVAAATIVSVALRGSKVAGVAGPRLASDLEPLPLREALRLPEFRALLFSVFSFGWSSFGVRVSVVPLFVAAALGGDASVAAWVLAAYAAGNALLIFPAGRWTDRLGRKPLLIIGMAIMTLGYLVFPASPTVGLAMACMFVAGAGSALANPAQQAVLADVVGKRPGGTVVAAYSMSADLGGVLGPLIAGAIVDLAGFGWAFAATAALLVVALSFWGVSPDSRRRTA